jgi:hypothetical protein
VSPSPRATQSLKQMPTYIKMCHNLKQYSRTYLGDETANIFPLNGSSVLRVTVISVAVQTKLTVKNRA